MMILWLKRYRMLYLKSNIRKLPASSPQLLWQLAVRLLVGSRSEPLHILYDGSHAVLSAEHQMTNRLLL